MKHFLFSCLVVLSSTTLFSQSDKCGTDLFYKKELAKNPGLISQQISFDNMVNDYVATHNSNTKAVRIIPVVFHVIHEGGAENISKAQIQDQIRILNEDYRRLNADTSDTPGPFKTIAADCNIEFRLANKDPQGNCTDGIVRVYSSKTNNASDDNGIKGVSYWPRSMYLNIWVVKSIDAGGANGLILGYAQLPFFGGASTDGVVIRHDYIGSIGTAVSPAGGANGVGRTATHEVGHWLGLRHIWGDATCGSDNVSDTPVHTTANSGCPAFPKTNTCTGAGANGEMFTNYMDYTNGECQNIFSAGQKGVMDAVLTTVSVRANVISGSNNTSTGVNTNPPNTCIPVADFAVDEFMICKGDNVTLTDGTWNGTPTQWQWSLPGGTPSTSSVQNPIVTYNAAGIYDVTLTATNQQGTNTKTKQAIIRVSDTDAEDINYLFLEDFELPAHYDRWIVMNPGGGANTWAYFEGAGYDTWYSVRANNFGNASGDVDEFISPSFKLNNIPSPKLTFKVSSAQTSSSSADVLKVYFSTDCGKTWTVRYSKSGAGLATAPIKGTPFTPNGTSQWRQESVTIPSSIASKPNVRIKFALTAGGGNNLFLDDINISSLTGVNNQAITDNLNFLTYPNPSQGDVTIYFNLLAKARTDLRLYDIVGKEVSGIYNGNLPSGQNQFTLNRSIVPAAGVYLLQLTVDGNRFTKRIIITD